MQIIYCMRMYLADPLRFQVGAHDLEFSCNPNQGHNKMFKLALMVLCPRSVTFVVIEAYGFKDNVVTNVAIVEQQGTCTGCNVVYLNIYGDCVSNKIGIYLFCVKQEHK